MGTIKDRNGKDLKEAEEINRWQEDALDVYNIVFNDPDNHNDVVIHLEPYILESEVKWVLGNITRNN